MHTATLLGHNPEIMCAVMNYLSIRPAIVAECAYGSKIRPAGIFFHKLRLIKGGNRPEMSHIFSPECHFNTFIFFKWMFEVLLCLKERCGG